MTFNQSGTFVYTPDIQVLIGTTKLGDIDVSSDVMNFTMDRQINAVSTFSCTLNNPGRKYNQLINTMDRIVVFLKRTNWVQCFTGYVTYAPIETFVPTPVTIQASCTLYLLQMTYWDNTLIEYQQLLVNYLDNAATQSNKTLNDGGVAQALVNLLYKVAGWPTENIHIQGIPASFINFAASAYVQLIGSSQGLPQDVVSQLASFLSTSSRVSGNEVVTQTTGTNGQPKRGVNSDQAPDGGVGTSYTISNASPLINSGPNNGKVDYPAKNPLNPVNYDLITADKYYCSIPWSYLQLKDQKVISDSKSWIAHNWMGRDNKGQPGDYSGRPMIVSCGNRSVVVRATSVPQDGHGNYDPKIDYIQLHPDVIAYLSGQLDDPKNSIAPGKVKTSISVTMDFAVQNATPSQNIHIGKQSNQGVNAKAVEAAASLGSTTSANSVSTSTVIHNAINTLIQVARGQVGDGYPANDIPGPTRLTPGKPGTGTGSFDCSGLVYWAYKQIGITLHGSDTAGECGPRDGSQAEIYGEWVPNTVQPQKGDILFWGWEGTRPAHASLLSEWVDSNGNGKIIQAVNHQYGVVESAINWPSISGGKTSGNSTGLPYTGARRPISLHKGSHFNYAQNISYMNSDWNADPNKPNERALMSLSNSWNTIFQAPQFDVRSISFFGSPRAFITDGSLLGDLQQIAGAGLRSFMSAPNGDFIAWFPDYYGLYGADPVLEVSEVEIIDCQIYHDDSQLATHVAVMGDVNGIGQSVNFADYLQTNGVVSIQDVTTMQLLFGSQKGSATGVLTNSQQATQALSALSFLNRYGLRPYTEEQPMIHSHQMEYMYALMTFMKKWAAQYVSTLSLTFMPEIYPGMRIVCNISNQSGSSNQYEFYVMAVQHSGDRTSGFSTEVQVTSPVKDGSIMSYGTVWGE